MQWKKIKMAAEKKKREKKTISFVSSASHCSETENGNDQKPMNVWMKIIIVSKSIHSMTICFENVRTYSVCGVVE